MEQNPTHPTVHCCVVNRKISPRYKVLFGKFWLDDMKEQALVDLQHNKTLTFLFKHTDIVL